MKSSLNEILPTAYTLSIRLPPKIACCSLVEHNLLFGALIVYLQEEFLDFPLDKISQQLTCFLFALENNRAILVGRAGFLEMEMAQQHLRDAKAIQDPLKVLQEKAESLQEISKAVESLAALLDPSFMNPGLTHFQQLRKILETKLFDNSSHDPYQVSTVKLIDIMCLAEFATARDNFIAALRDARSGPRSETIKLLFTPFQSSWVTNCKASAAGFAKALARGGIPLAWLRAVNGQPPSGEDCKFYIPLTDDTKTNPVNFLVALDEVWRVGIFMITNKIDNGRVNVTGTINQDTRGHDGLAKLKKHFDDGTEVEQTSRSLKLLKSVAIDPRMSHKGNSLEVAMEFRIKPLQVTEPNSGP